MRYAFVSLSIIAIWFAIIMIVGSLNLSGVTLPILGIIMTIILFNIGFRSNK